MEATKEELALWKQKHGKVYEIVLKGGKRCYLKLPTRAVLSASLSVSNDPLKSDEIILNSCWLGGDEEIKTDLNLFLSVRSQLSELFDLQTAKLVKH